MSKDLSIFHLANRAEVESVTRLGPRTSVRFMTAADADTPLGLSYVLQESLAAGVTPIDGSTVVVEIDGVPLRRYSGEGSPPLGAFKFLTGAGASGEDKILLAESPLGRFRVKYSTLADSALDVFQLRGKGFKYVTNLRVGGVRIDAFTVVSDGVLELEVPVALSNSVVVENITALVEIDETPVPSDIIFDISTRARRSTGPKLLQQRFLTLLMSPDGADLLNLLPKGLSVTPSLRTVILNRVSLAVNVTKSLLRQTTPANAPASEVLANAYVEGVTVDPNTGEATAQIKLQTVSGQSLSVPVGV